MFFRWFIGAVSRNSAAQIESGLRLDMPVTWKGNQPSMKIDHQRELRNQLEMIVVRSKTYNDELMLPILMNVGGSLTAIRDHHNHLKTCNPNPKKISEHLIFENEAGHHRNLPDDILAALDVLKTHITACENATASDPSLLARIVTEYEFYRDKLIEVARILLRYPEFKISDELTNKLRSKIPTSNPRPGGL